MIVVDVETTGTEPHKHSLVSIGAVDFYNPSNQFYAECRIWQGAHVQEEALAVNGYTREQIADPKKKSEKEVVQEFLQWAMQCPERTIAGQNPSFDEGFLRAAAERGGINWPLARRTIDLHTVCYFHALRRGIKPSTLNGHTALNADAIAQYCGISAESRPHVAINGARIEAEMFNRFFHDEPLLDEWKQYPVPWMKAKSE